MAEWNPGEGVKVTLPWANFSMSAIFVRDTTKPALHRNCTIIPTTNSQATSLQFILS